MLCCHFNKNPNNPTTAYLGLGANIGDPKTAIQTALKELDALPTITVNRVSSLYRTAPVGLADQPDFVNAVAQIQTTLDPEALLAAILSIEKKMGRERNIRWGPRVIDIDVLLFGYQTVKTASITLPHPRMRERAFVLAPLAEIAPNIVLPGDKVTVAELARGLADQSVSLLEQTEQ